MPDSEHLRCIVIAGQDGAGKTTFAREFLPKDGVFHFINADLIAGGISPLQPQSAALAARRLPRAAGRARRPARGRSAPLQAGLEQFSGVSRCRRCLDCV